MVITGASSGIGLALAKQVAHEGADVVMIARRSGPLDEAKAKVVAQGGKGSIEAIALDISREDAVNEAMARVQAAGPVDVLVNNAGVVMPGRFVELPMSEFRSMMDINYFGTVHMCKALVPGMITRKERSHLQRVVAGWGDWHLRLHALRGQQVRPVRLFAGAASRALAARHRGQRLHAADTDTPQLAFENQYKPKGDQGHRWDGEGSAGRPSGRRHQKRHRKKAAGSSPTSARAFCRPCTASSPASSAGSATARSAKPSAPPAGLAMLQGSPALKGARHGSRFLPASYATNAGLINVLFGLGILPFAACATPTSTASPSAFRKEKTDHRRRPSPAREHRQLAV